jgi:hypothetical protein
MTDAATNSAAHGCCLCIRSSPASIARHRRGGRSVDYRAAPSRPVTRDVARRRSWDSLANWVGAGKGLRLNLAGAEAAASVTTVGPSSRLAYSAPNVENGPRLHACRASCTARRLARREDPLAHIRRARRALARWRGVIQGSAAAAPATTASRRYAVRSSSSNVVVADCIEHLRRTTPENWRTLLLHD